MADGQGRLQVSLADHAAGPTNDGCGVRVQEPEGTVGGVIVLRATAVVTGKYVHVRINITKQEQEEVGRGGGSGSLILTVGEWAALRSRLERPTSESDADAELDVQIREIIHVGGASALSGH